MGVTDKNVVNQLVWTEQRTLIVIPMGAHGVLAF